MNNKRNFLCKLGIYVCVWRTKTELTNHDVPSRSLCCKLPMERIKLTVLISSQTPMEWDQIQIAEPNQDQNTHNQQQQKNTAR